MYSSGSRHLTLSPALQAAGLLTLAAASGLVAWSGPGLLVPAGAVLLVGAGVILRWPHLGVLAMFSAVLFKPEALQGGPSVNLALAALLSIVLFVDLVLRRRFEILQSNELRVFLLIGLLVVVNWYFLGSMEPPAYKSELDLSGRTMFRYAYHLTFLTLMIAFTRTPGQLVAVTGLFLLSVFWTLPGAISHSYTPPATGNSPEALRALAVSGVQAAENANRLAFIVLMGISYLWFWLRETRGGLVRIAGTGALLTLVLTVFLSGSRSGLLNLGLLLALLLRRSRARLGQIAAVLLMVIGCVVIAVLFVPQPILERILTFTSDDRFKGLTESNRGRWVALVSGLTLAAQRPFMGVGIGNYRWMTALETTFQGAAHNAYILMLAEGGAILLGAHLLLFWVTARDLRWAASRAAALPSLGIEWVINATRVNLTLLLFFSIFAEAWKEFFFLLILGTASIAAQIYRRESSHA
jgi:hypothetical protein